MKGPLDMGAHRRALGRTPRRRGASLFGCACALAVLALWVGCDSGAIPAGPARGGTPGDEQPIARDFFLEKSLRGAVLVAPPPAGNGASPAGSAAHYAAPGEVPLIPRELLLGAAERTLPRVSPDGRWLAFVAPHGGAPNLWVAPLSSPEAARPLTSDTGRGIRDYFWAHDNRRLLFLRDRLGDENWHVHCVDMETGALLDLTPLEGMAAAVEHVSPAHPEEIVVGINHRDPQFHDLYRVNIASGERWPLFENNGFSNLYLDDQ
jgi:WD40-like Beta Propeller Repeat